MLTGSSRPTTRGSPSNVGGLITRTARAISTRVTLVALICVVLVLTLPHAATKPAVDQIDSQPGTTSPTCSGTRIGPGDDLDAVVNSNPVGTATTFCLAAGTYEVDEVVTLRSGDKLIGPEGKIVTRGPASYGVPTARIMNAAALPRLLQLEGSSIEVRWVDVSGAVGQYDDRTQAECVYWGDAADRCPVVGTGTAIGAGTADGSLLIEYVTVHDNAAEGVSSANGKLFHSNLYNNGTNPDFWGWSAAAVKGVDEYEAAYNYVHDNPANGLWCDHGCKDVPGMQNGFWAHHNLLVNNGRWGIRYEYSPRFTDGWGQGERVDPAVTALVENNEIHGNGASGGYGGATMLDAQNATFRGNDFGAATIAGVRYPPNSGGKAIEFAWTDQSDRTDLWNGKAYRNRLGGENISGCNIGHDPDIVECHDNFGAGVSGIHKASIATLVAAVLYGIYRSRR